MRTTYNGGVEGTFKSLPFGDGQVVTGADTDADHYAMLDHDTETDTDHAQFRQYSNTQGRWLSPDPYHGSYKWRNPQSFNRYVYAGNNPLAVVDPTGLQLCFECNFNKTGGGSGGNPLDPGSVSPLGPADGSDGYLDALNQAESGNSGGGNSGVIQNAIKVGVQEEADQAAAKANSWLNAYDN
jgi:RHS repeat-associated protein